MRIGIQSQVELRPRPSEELAQRDLADERALRFKAIRLKRHARLDVDCGRVRTQRRCIGFDGGSDSIERRTEFGHEVSDDAMKRARAQGRGEVRAGLRPNRQHAWPHRLPRSRGRAGGLKIRDHGRQIELPRLPLFAAVQHEKGIVAPQPPIERRPS